MQQPDVVSSPTRLARHRFVLKSRSVPQRVPWTRHHASAGIPQATALTEATWKRTTRHQKTNAHACIDEVVRQSLRRRCLKPWGGTAAVQPVLVESR